MALLLGRCAGVTPPTREQQRNAERLFPGITAEKLFEGKRHYHHACGSCHVLYAPESRSRLQWRAELDSMRRKVRLTPESYADILRYLMSAARDADAADTGGTE
jgi:hypothetical protein